MAAKDESACNCVFCCALKYLYQPLTNSCPHPPANVPAHYCNMQHPCDHQTWRGKSPRARIGCGYTQQAWAAADPSHMSSPACCCPSLKGSGRSSASPLPPGGNGGGNSDSAKAEMIPVPSWPQAAWWWSMAAGMFCQRCKRPFRVLAGQQAHKRLCRASVGGAEFVHLLP